MAINTEVDKLPWKMKTVAKNEAYLAENKRPPSWAEYQRLHGFREVEYSVKLSEQKMLDYANPAWAPADYYAWGQNTKK